MNVAGEIVTLIQCACGCSRYKEHPIQHCPGCEKEAYEAEFARLRGERRYTMLLGVDRYSDTIYVYAGGVVAAIEGRAERMLRYRDADKLVARIRELEEENKTVLAENARFRRRLEGSPASGEKGPVTK